MNEKNKWLKVLDPDTITTFKECLKWNKSEYGMLASHNNRLPKTGEPFQLMLDPFTDEMFILFN